MLHYRDTRELQNQISNRIVLFIAGLVFSGVTAFPIEGELRIAHQWITRNEWDNVFTKWIACVYQGVHETNSAYPFISYGSDWLGFAHIIIAIAFLGPLKDPVKNRWIIEFGLIACLAIFPFALIAGAVRGIPIFWRFIDCMFGIVGGWILWSCYIRIKLLESIKSLNA
ncbi:hypothetical protein [Chryseolinea sp. H1M3-3]|uniref:hypothetical protein n=1 Tax=Chryseolinea sp. H1M3-3 TaxID=3034144 RepID=UPI0023EAF145|nr:hypothetical protein [Chryseolinea sp. H1M3-3]